jgi:hypothetical protein
MLGHHYTYMHILNLSIICESITILLLFFKQRLLLILWSVFKIRLCIFVLTTVALFNLCLLCYKLLPLSLVTHSCPHLAPLSPPQDLVCVYMCHEFLPLIRPCLHLTPLLVLKGPFFLRHSIILHITIDFGATCCACNRS